MKDKMKTLLITLLLSISIFGQSGKKVWSPALEDSVRQAISDSAQTLTQSQRDSVGAIVSDSLDNFDDSLLLLYKTYSLSLVTPSIGTNAVFDYVQDNIYIDSVYAVVKDSLIIFNIDTCSTISGTFSGLFAGNITADENTTGEYFTPVSTIYIPENTFIRIAIKNMYGESDEDLFIKIYYGN